MTNNLLDNQLESLVRQYGLATVSERLANLKPLVRPQDLVPSDASGASGWDNRPEYLGCNVSTEAEPRIVECKRLGHVCHETRLGNCWYKYSCDKCGIYYEVDSSD